MMKCEYQRSRAFFFENFDENGGSIAGNADLNLPLNEQITIVEKVDLDEDTAISAVDLNLPLKKAIKIVAQIFSMYPDDCDRSDAEALSQELADFVNKLLSQSEISGDADDWHNIVVDIAKKDYYNLCCDLLEEGLRRFPGNADLLGDYLQYGTSCGRIEK